MVVTLPSPDTYVRFVSKRTGKVLADDDELYHVDKDPAKAEHWWRIIPTNGQTDRYIIKNVTTGRAIWCRFKNRRAGCIDDDGKWADNWQKSTLSSTHMASKSLFSQKIAINVLPMVAGGEFEVKASQKNEWKWGEKNTITTKWGISQALKVPKNSTFVATLTATKKEISVPFKITWVAKDSGAKNITYGVYKGVSYYGASTSVKPKSGASGTAYKDENRSLEDDSEGTNGGAVYEERTYQEDNEQADFTSSYPEETTYNAEYSYDGQGSYEEDQAYNNGTEKEDENQAEPEYEENKPCEESYDGEEGHQSNEIDYDEQGSWKQDNEDGESYHTGYQQNKSGETDNQEQSSFEAEAEETTLQSTYEQDSYGNGNSYEDRQYDNAQVENLSLEDSAPIYQESTELYSGGYSQQNPDANGYESNQLNNDFIDSESYTSKYHDTSHSREDDSSNEQRYSEGENNNAYGQTNEYDEPSRPTHQDKNYDENHGYGQPSKPTYEENTCGQSNHYERTNEDATIEQNSYGSINTYDRNSNYDRYQESTYGENAESSYNRYQQY
ncbi:hypothetical protein DID88_001362 [Monilinia fructigena]|uniref:Uncharacterized protein n=1 Tax=Monilinia fructigena TaxID=38457 RepID=A0A395IZ16_9HELO|nr:hypothetical protein DID88_001362 [Monilinia fructigena]